MKRKILLLEPKYRNKYPPIGLMKIATYHRRLGDKVTFFKGDVTDLVLDELTKKCISKFKRIDKNFDCSFLSNAIREYIRVKRAVSLEKLNLGTSQYELLLINALDEFSRIYKNKEYRKYPKWDRVYVTTLFTFYWKVTVKAIHDTKHLVKKADQIFVGGVLASLLHKELEEETGIKAHEGLLDTPGMLDPDNPLARNIIIDDLPLDYSILDEIDYEYPTGSAYFTFMTKGCTRKCSFCSVPILEPTYKPKIDTIDKFEEIKETYGEQRNLLLMDNNVLASPKFPEIIQEIKDMGFYKGAKYVEPNQLEIAIKNLVKGLNDKALIKRCFILYNTAIKRIRGDNKQLYYNVLEENGLLKFETTTKKGILKAYKEIGDLYEKYRNKSPKTRYVDFNQGTDARYVTDEYMRLMSEIPIHPLRIAFDYWGIKKKYENAIRLAAKYGINRLSNYILFNFKDKPEDFYNRINLNMELSEELNIHIYSFPMKFIPLFGEEAKTRTYIGAKWNKKFIRAIQSILNVTKGIVAPKKTFFQKAFGKNLEEFFEILYMPETYIIYRFFFEEMGITQKWQALFHSLTEEEKLFAYSIIESNDFTNIEEKTNDPKILALLSHYKVKREDVKEVKRKDLDFKKTKKYFDKLIKEDRFLDLTLTYDYEPATIRKKKKLNIVTSNQNNLPKVTEPGQTA